MLEVVEIIIIIIVLFISIKKMGLKRNYLFLFNIAWITVLIFSKWNIYNFFQVSSGTYFLLFVGVLCFNLSMFIKVKKVKELELGEPSEKAMALLYKVNYIMLVFSIILGIRMYKLIGSIENYPSVRLIFYGLWGGERLFERAYIYLLYAVFLNLMPILFILGLYLFIEKNQKKILIVTVLNIIIYDFISAGRSIFAYGVLTFICVLKTREKKLLKIILVMFIIVFIITFLRVKDNYTQLHNLIYYFTGPIVFLDVILEQKIIEGPYYGQIFLDFFIGDFKYFFVKLAQSQSVIDVIGEKLAVMRSISSNVDERKFNALPTMFFWYYMDFKIFGVILYSFFSGLIIKIFYKANLKRDLIYPLVAFSYMETQLVFTVQNITITMVRFFIVIIVFLLIKKKKKFINQES